MSETNEGADPQGEAEEPSEATRPKKKRKKKAKAPREGVPSFAQRFPRDESLDALLAAFDRGDYGRVREDGARLVKSTDDPAVRRAAEELLRRIEPDPLAKYMLLAACLLLAFFTVWYFSHRLAPTP
ncbi:hypothetical protein [Polyangium fumosum]|uniref:Uncharacterized protein n=1 Tax=Polyangium fumosum TaxID=889272 RepID=A0A4U1JKN4_9BACT|nr:hypothetical protein [Polyangium fumosum]TKD13147.1 hypothetical protein E8A74_00910 [Polyangium fumosum]